MARRVKLAGKSAGAGSIELECRFIECGSQTQPCNKLGTIGLHLATFFRLLGINQSVLVLIELAKLSFVS